MIITDKVIFVDLLYIVMYTFIDIYVSSLSVFLPLILCGLPRRHK